MTKSWSEGNLFQSSGSSGFTSMRRAGLRAILGLCGVLLAAGAVQAQSPGSDNGQAPVTIELLDADMRAYVSVDGTGVVLPRDGRPARATSGTGRRR